jgi:hypothetical protein
VFVEPAHVHASLSIAVSSVHLRDAACGLSQQMTFWGHDVRYPGGNALVRFGLKRSPSTGLTGTSCYSIPWENGMIELHGAIASWTPPPGETGCVFCREIGRLDLWCGRNPPIPGRESGLTGTAERRWLAFQPLLRWLLTYEQWILATHGATWRNGCWRALKRLPRAKHWLPPDLALKWWELATVSIPPRPKNMAQSPIKSCSP